MRVYQVTFIEPPRAKGLPRGTASWDVVAPNRQEAMARGMDLCARSQPGWYLKGCKDIGAAGLAA